MGEWGKRERIEKIDKMKKTTLTEKGEKESFQLENTHIHKKREREKEDSSAPAQSTDLSAVSLSTMPTQEQRVLPSATQRAQGAMPRW